LSMATLHDVTRGAALEQFRIQVKSQKGKGASNLVLKALDYPGLYVFGELFDEKNVKDLETSDNPTFQLLTIFTNGVYGDYKKAVGLPRLTEMQEKKLRQLTIVSLSAKTNIISYSTLQAALHMDSLRELEDLIIDAIYNNLFEGKLDQRKKQLEIETTIGRDLKPGDLATLIKTLEDWCKKSDLLVLELDKKRTDVTEYHDRHLVRQQDMKLKEEKVVAQILQQLDTEVDPTGDFGGRRRRGQGGGGGAMGNMLGMMSVLGTGGARRGGR